MKSKAREGARARRIAPRIALAALLAPPVAAFFAGACSAPSGVSLPLISSGPEYVPVEGLERTELAARARCAILSARGEKPIEVITLPSGERRELGIRGDVVALAGPTPAGAFVYAVRDERAGLALHRADLRGSDRSVARFDRPITALSLAPDGEHVAILAPFDEDDPRSRGGVLRELVTVELSDDATHATGFACWNAAPAWIGDGRLACIVAAEDGEHSVVVLDPRDPASARDLGPGDRVLAADAGKAGAPSLVVFRGESGRTLAFRAPVDGGERTALALRGLLEPLACAGTDLVVAFSSPTLGVEPQWELDLLGPRIALATIKVHDLASGDFATVETRASPRRLWSAGRLDP